MPTETGHTVTLDHIVAAARDLKKINVKIEKKRAKLAALEQESQDLSTYIMSARAELQDNFIETVDEYIQSIIDEEA